MRKLSSEKTEQLVGEELGLPRAAKARVCFPTHRNDSLQAHSLNRASAEVPSHLAGVNRNRVSKAMKDRACGDTEVLARRRGPGQDFPRVESKY